MTDKKIPDDYDVAASFAAIHKGVLEQSSAINPKLAALAAQLDAAHACARRLEAAQKDADDIDAAEDLCAAA